MLYGFRHGRGYKRGLDNRVLLKHWRRVGGEPVHVRRELQADERERFLAAVTGDLRAVHQTLQHGKAVLVGHTTAAAALTWIERCLAMDLPALTADAAEYLRVYRPVGILPPDQYQSVVLQLTEGCPHNRCTFCNFYRDRPFRIKHLPEFRAHVAAVRRFLRSGVLARRSVFLADANALSMPQRHLEAALASIWDGLADTGASLNGIYAFMDVFTGSDKPVTDLRRLAELGVRRVYLGVETGCPDLLRFLNKPGGRADVLRHVGALREAGIAVGVIVMAGVGGDRYAARHQEQTVDLLSALALGRSDLVYLSEFVDHRGSAYARAARAEGIRPLSPIAVQMQMQAFRAAARSGVDVAVAPRVAPYDIREFLY